MRAEGFEQPEEIISKPLCETEAVQEGVGCFIYLFICLGGGEEISLLEWFSSSGKMNTLTNGHLNFHLCAFKCWLL